MILLRLMAARCLRFIARRLDGGAGWLIALADELAPLTAESTISGQETKD